MTRRATSNPVSPGIWTSSITRSGWYSSITRSASTPFPAWPRISTPPSCSSRKHSSSRASCSSSTTTVRRSFSEVPRRAVIYAISLAGRHAELRDDDPRARALAGHAVELQLVVRAVDDAQALVDVAQPDAGALHAPGVGRRDPDAVVDDVDDRVVAVAQAADGDAPFAQLVRQAVLDRVLDQRLQHHARARSGRASPGRCASRPSAAARSGCSRCRGIRRSPRAPRAG